MPHQRLGDLDCQIEREQGTLRAAVVLCHGYGAPGGDLVPLAGELQRGESTIAQGVRFYFPAAPINMAPWGLPGGRAWWPIDMERLTGAAELVNEEDSEKQLAAAMPLGLGAAPEALLATIEAIHAETGLGWDRLVIGGFSQGAMLSVEVTLRLSEPIGGLVVASGALVSGLDWPRRAAEKPPLEVIQGHGRQDPLLPFAGAEALREIFEEAGHQIKFLPFDGSHAIAPSLIEALARRLGRLLV